MFLFVDWLFSSLSIYHKVMTLFGNILKLKSFFFLIIFLYPFPFLFKQISIFLDLYKVKVSKEQFINKL